jgi:type II secretory pathway pseudopilin PulG
MTTESTSTERANSRRWPLWVCLAMIPVILFLAALAWVAWIRLFAPPMIGEPFDTRPFPAISIPADQNAFTDYGEATNSMAPPPTFGTGDPQTAFFKSMDDTVEGGWPKANADLRKWLTDNQAALGIWKRGTEKADGMEVSPDRVDIDTLLPTSQGLRDLARLALLQAARTSAEKSPAEAWPWYRDVLRSSRHVERHSVNIQRLIGGAIQAMAVEPVLRWSSRRELTAADLRRALADVQSIDKMTPPASENLKVEYLSSRKTMKNHAAGWAGVPLWFIGYPERVRESLNIVYANWLSQVDRPRFRRKLTKGQWQFFIPDADTPPDPKILTPEEIEDRIGLARGSIQARLIGLLLPAMTAFVEAVDREQTRQAALDLGLALQLYYREHGRFPAKLDELVEAKYLPAIPADPYGKGEPFPYRREADPKAGALLWSVWLDGIDQDGKIEADPQRADSPGDKIFRIVSPRSAN